VAGHAGDDGAFAGGELVVLLGRLEADQAFHCQRRVVGRLVELRLRPNKLRAVAGEVLVQEDVLRGGWRRAGALLGDDEHRGSSTNERTFINATTSPIVIPRSLTKSS